MYNFSKTNVPSFVFAPPNTTTLYLQCKYKAHKFPKSYFIPLFSSSKEMNKTKRLNSATNRTLKSAQILLCSEHLFLLSKQFGAKKNSKGVLQTKNSSLLVRSANIWAVFGSLRHFLSRFWAGNRPSHAVAGSGSGAFRCK